ncbi:MAG: hypothetical protein QOI78_1753 [Actinomycetota bacterium]|jgi:peptidoglycan/LPS O-acetylase OafA/YrhL|nr:hypothetical protein [Actinomycetota bacterium]
MTYSPPPPSGHPQPWVEAPPRGIAVAVAALALGLLGCVLPLLPVDMTGWRAYVAFPFGLAGLALGVFGCVGRRRGKPVAAIGVAFSVLALVLGMILVANATIPR